MPHVLPASCIVGMNIDRQKIIEIDGGDCAGKDLLVWSSKCLASLLFLCPLSEWQVNFPLKLQTLHPALHPDLYLMSIFCILVCASVRTSWCAMSSTIVCGQALHVFALNPRHDRCNAPSSSTCPFAVECVEDDVAWIPLREKSPLLGRRIALNYAPVSEPCPPQRVRTLPCAGTSSRKSQAINPKF